MAPEPDVNVRDDILELVVEERIDSLWLSIDHSAILNGSEELSEGGGMEWSLLAFVISIGNSSSSHLVVRKHGNPLSLVLCLLGHCKSPGCLLLWEVSDGLEASCMHQRGET